MKDEKTVALIKKVISKIKEKYNIFITYDYNEEDDLYEIWHNRKDLEYEDEEFDEYVSEILYEYLFSKGYPNVYFTYDYYKSQELFTWDPQEKLATNSYNTSININKKPTHIEEYFDMSKSEVKEIDTDATFESPNNLDSDDFITNYETFGPSERGEQLAA